MAEVVISVGWEVGNASKLNSSKSSASRTAWFVVANEGWSKASVHGDSQPNDWICGGKGSEAVCFLGAQPDPRGFLTAGWSGFDSDKRLFSVIVSECC